MRARAVGHHGSVDDERDEGARGVVSPFPRPARAGEKPVGPTRVGAGRRPHPGPEASEFALTVWRATEQVADVLDQFTDEDERQRAAELIYRDADGTVRTRHGLLRPVPGEDDG